MFKKIVNFIKRDIWRVKTSKSRCKKNFLIRNLRIIILTLRGFNQDKCSLRASALTFYTLLSIVPVFAMAFGIAKGFGFEKLLEQHILDNFSFQSEAITNAIEFANTMLDHTRGGLVAGLGVIVLFWSIIKVLTNIEKSFNDIWGIKTMRSFSRRMSDYLSIMLICPLFLIFSSGATVFISSQAILAAERVPLLGALSPFIYFSLEILPYLVTAAAFTFIYIFIPNTKVNWKSGIIAGILAGAIYQLVQMFYINFQIGATKYNAIYGSFAALPLFLVWLQLSWRVVLFGAEISFAHQNVDTYEFEPDCLNASRKFKNILALRIVNLLASNFASEKEPVTVSKISQDLEIPARLLQDLLNELSRAKIITSVQTKENKGLAYQAGFDINKMTIEFVLEKLNTTGSSDIPVAGSDELNKIEASLQEFEALIQKSPSNILLKDI